MRSLRCAALVCVTVGVSTDGMAQGFGDLEFIWAMDALARGDDTRAIDHLRSYLSRPASSESKLEARLVAAGTALRLEAYGETLTLLEGLERDLADVGDFVLAYRARALRSESRWDEATAVWKQLLAQYPDSPLAEEATYGLADAHWAQGRVTEAMDAYAAAIKAYPRSSREPVARFNQALMLEKKKRLVEASAGYRYLAFYRLGDPVSDLAQARFQALVAAGKTEAPNLWQELQRVDLLLSSRSLEDAERALAELQPKVRGSSLKSAYESRLAKLAYRRRDFDAAAQAFTRLADAASGQDRLEYLQWVARIYSTANKTQDAIRVYLMISEEAKDPRDAKEGLFKAAWLGYNSGDFTTAIKLFNQYLELYPRDPAADEAVWYIAWNAFRQGDLPRAVQSLRRLRDRFPGSSLVQRTHYWEGRFAALMGDLALARQAWGEAVAQEPLSYYGILARQRAKTLESDVRPVVLQGGGLFVASLDEVPPVDATRLDGEEDLPSNLATLLLDVEPSPMDSEVLDWTSPQGKRALRLMKLGLDDAAASVVQRLPARKDRSSAEVAYGRARVLYQLGDFNTAYRLVDGAFRQAFKTPPEGASKRYFQIAYPDAHSRTVTAAAREFSISPLLILAVMRQESGFDHRARSWAAAQGLMQIIPPTGGRIAEALGVPDFDTGALHDPAVNVRFGAWYLSQLVTKFNGNLPLAIASYNAGPEAVSSWLDKQPGRTLDEFVEEIPFRETRHYVKRVLGNLAVYRALYTSKALVLPERVPASYQDNIDF